VCERRWACEAGPAGTPERGGVVAKAIELVQLGRLSGYNSAELVEGLP
jgi:hypothetical protein